MSLREAIAALLEDPLDQILARSILGTTDAGAIADRVSAFVAAQLGRTIVGCPLFTQSVGAVFGVDLDDGSRVVVKAHALGDHQRGFASHDQIAAAYSAQAELAAAGLPCARVLAPPAAFGDGVAAIMTWLPPGERDAPHEPATRRAMAGFLARTVELGATLAARHRLVRAILPADAVFPPPHNALFDFTAPQGAWIDDHARRARAVLDAPAPLVVMHTDISCANIIVSHGAVTGAYDMDSIAWIDELRCLGSVAVHFTYTGGDRSTLPTADEARAFIADYEVARGVAFTARDHARIDAAMLYAMAYTARCEGDNPGAMTAAAGSCPFRWPSQSR